MDIKNINDEPKYNKKFEVKIYMRCRFDEFERIAHFYISTNDDINDIKDLGDAKVYISTPYDDDDPHKFHHNIAINNWTFMAKWMRNAKWRYIKDEGETLFEYIMKKYVPYYEWEGYKGNKYLMLTDIS